MKLVKLLLMLLFVGVLHSQIHQTEIIPYRLVPSQAEGYGCWLDLEVIALPKGVEIGSDEEERIYRAIVKKEMGEIGWNEQYIMLNNKQYVLVKIQVPSPYGLEVK
jgi:hypothetical protein